MNALGRDYWFALGGCVLIIVAALLAFALFPGWFS